MSLGSLLKSIVVFFLGTCILKEGTLTQLAALNLNRFLATAVPVRTGDGMRYNIKK